MTKLVMGQNSGGQFKAQILADNANENNPAHEHILFDSDWMMMRVFESGRVPMTGAGWNFNPAGSNGPDVRSTTISFEDTGSIPLLISAMTSETSVTTWNGTTLTNDKYQFGRKRGRREPTAPPGVLPTNYDPTGIDHLGTGPYDLGSIGRLSFLPSVFDLAGTTLGGGHPGWGSGYFVDLYRDSMTVNNTWKHRAGGITPYTYYFNYYLITLEGD